MRKSRSRHPENHRLDRSGWLRAAVLGSNDAIVSTASLMMGVAASSAPMSAVLLAGIAGLVAGSMSMAVGEYVSVSSQLDVERADIALEKHELANEPRSELAELATIYERRGLDKELSMKVAVQLMEHDALGAHLRDELGIDEGARARPLQAAWISAVGFALFAMLPIVALLLAPAALRIAGIGVVSVLSLVSLGALGARLGGAPVGRAALRVTVGGILAMAITAAIGRAFGVIAG